MALQLGDFVRALQADGRVYYVGQVCYVFPASPGYVRVAWNYAATAVRADEDPVWSHSNQGRSTEWLSADGGVGPYAVTRLPAPWALSLAVYLAGGKPVVPGSGGSE